MQKILKQLTSNCELERLLRKGKEKENYWINERWIRGKTTTEFPALRAKTYSYLIDDSDENKKAKTQKGVP